MQAGVAAGGAPRRRRVRRRRLTREVGEPGVADDRQRDAAERARARVPRVRARRGRVRGPVPCEAQVALAYAWNENTEGGWLLPTKGNGTMRLDAVAKALLS